MNTKLWRMRYGAIPSAHVEGVMMGRCLSVLTPG